MFKRISNLIKGFLGLFVSGLEKQNPEALLEVEKENLRKQISEYNKGLAAHAGLCERLMSQVKREGNEIKELSAKTAAHIKAGNRKLAGEYALRLQKVKQEHETNVAQLGDAEKTYEELKRARDIAVKSARDKIDSLKRLIGETKVAKATAELNEMAAGLIGEIGGAGDTLNRLEEMVAQEREIAMGRARVSRDSIDTTELKEMEAERSAMEEVALADFAAESGIVMDDKTSSNEGPNLEDQKTM
jgi:phage shock protein A